MINRYEMRIGNWIAVKHAPRGIITYHQIKKLEETTLRVDRWDQVLSGATGQDFEYSSDELQPIELTPGILAKLGFKSTYEGSKTLKLDGDHNFVVHIAPSGYEVCIQTGQFDDYSGIPIKYVHQLQNQSHDFGTDINIELLIP